MAKNHQFSVLSFIANFQGGQPRLHQLQRRLGRNRGVLATMLEAGLIAAEKHQGARGAPATLLSLTPEGWRAYHAEIAAAHTPAASPA